MLCVCVCVCVVSRLLLDARELSQLHHFPTFFPPSLSALVEACTALWNQEFLVPPGAWSEPSSLTRRLVSRAHSMMRIAFTRVILHTVAWSLLFVPLLAAPTVATLRAALRLVYGRRVLSSKPFSWNGGLSGLSDCVYLVTYLSVLHVLVRRALFPPASLSCVRCFSCLFACTSVSTPRSLSSHTVAIRARRHRERALAPVCV